MTSLHKVSVHLGPPRSYWEIVGFQFPVLNGALLVASLRFSEDPKKHKSCFFSFSFPPTLFFSFPFLISFIAPQDCGHAGRACGETKDPCSPRSPCISNGLFP